jgi:hypothetical protein
VVDLYTQLRARAGPSRNDVRAAARHLVDQFAAADRRAGGVVENPSLGPVTPRRRAPAAAAQVSQETLERIAVACEAIVALLAGVHGVENPLDSS